MVKTDKPCYCLGFGNTVNYIIIWWPFTVWPKLGSASFGVRQWKVTKLWYNLQCTQNLDNNHGLSITLNCIIKPAYNPFDWECIFPIVIKEKYLLFLLRSTTKKTKWKNSNVYEYWQQQAHFRSNGQIGAPTGKLLISLLNEQNPHCYIHSTQYFPFFISPCYQ